VVVVSIGRYQAAKEPTTTNINELIRRMKAGRLRLHRTYVLKAKRTSARNTIRVARTVIALESWLHVADVDNADRSSDEKCSVKSPAGGL